MVVGGMYVRERSNKDLADVLRTNLSQWMTSSTEDETQWLVPPDLVPTWMTGKDGELLLKSLPEWQAESKLDD